MPGRLLPRAITKPRTFWAFAAAQTALLVPLLVLERRMKRTGGPGIIAFELAGSPARSRAILETWGADGRSAARLSLLLDYPFLVAYSGLHVVGCAAASDALRRRGALALADVGGVVAMAQPVAGAFDAAENAALLGVLAGREGRLSAIARACARAKFALLTVGWLYGALGLASRVTAAGAWPSRARTRPRARAGARARARCA